MAENWQVMAAAQHGAIARRQLLCLGMTAGKIRTLLQRGDLVCAGSGVYRLAAAPTSWKQDLFLAHLIAGPDSAISHRSAGMEWGLDAVEAPFIEISSPRKLRDVPFRPHRTFSLAPGDVTGRGNLPVTNPTRTLLDLSLVLSVRELERAYESALRKGLTDQGILIDRFETWARSGRNGVTKWRKLLALRHEAAKPTESYLETLLLQAVREGRLPVPVRQYPIGKNGIHVRRFDFAYPPEKVAIEADSAAWHLGRESWGKDLRVQNEAASLGWLILRFTYWDITERPHSVIATISEVLLQRQTA